MKKVIVTILCLGFVFTTYSQQTEKINSGTFQPGWYLGANAGLNWFLGEGNNPFSSKAYFSFDKNKGFIGRAVIGYDFTPVIGLKGMIGYAHHGYWPDLYSKKNADGSSPISSFGSQNLTVDMTVNLSNWWADYNPDRAFDISAFGGTGFAHRNKANLSDDWYGLIGRIGLQGDFHLTKQLYLNLILEDNVVGDKYNDHVETLIFDTYPALTLGLTYHFREKSKVSAEVESKPEIVEKPVTPEPVVPPQPAAEPAPVVKEEPKPAIANKEVAPVQKQIPELEVDIFYTIGKADIKNEKQQAAIAKVIDYLHAYPDAKILIVGYADKATGTIARNREVSKKRAEFAAKLLINNYSISADRIVTKWYGDTVQPYKEVPQNRLVKVNLIPLQ